MKAIVAVAHSILNAVWHLLADGIATPTPARTTSPAWTQSKAKKSNAIKKLNSLGFEVTITPATAA